MKSNEYCRIFQGLGHFWIEKKLHKIRVVASRHQLGAGCEAVAVTLAHALGEGRASVLLFWVFLNNNKNLIVYLVVNCVY